MKDVTIHLTNNEALVLIEFLLRFRNSEKLTLADQAEEQILWDLCAMLETKFPELLNENYKALLDKARDIVRFGNENE